MVKTIEMVNGKVRMLDQSKLPHEVLYIECTDYMMVAEGIKKLWIRGAPAIGIAAAMGVAIGAQEIKAKGFEEFYDSLEPVFSEIISTRPTAVNIEWAINRLKKLLFANKELSVEKLKGLLINEADNMLKEDVEVNKAIGKWGAMFIKDGDTIITHCNAGSLATGGYGTATAPMRVAVEQGKRIKVIADETRPVLQGSRLTAWELMQDKIPVTLITDNTAGALMQRGEINLAIVGTDRTAANGDVANKIGTYSLAILCKEHGIPFYVAAPTSSIDFSMPSGEYIPIEERDPAEVTDICGVRIAPRGVKVRNLAFDVTPAKYITSIITEKGVFKPEGLSEINKTVGFRNNNPRVLIQMSIEKLWEYYRDDLLLVEGKIKETLDTVAPSISMVGEHLLMGGGKRIRPFLAILCSKIFGYSGEKINILACSVESIHTASLLHDDIVDSASVRRGRPPAHSLWGNQIVVLVGDFLYSNALRLVNLLKDQKIMDALSSATTRMSEGELIQLSKKSNPNTTEEDYMKIITGKTAILMSAACRGGAILGKATLEEEDALATFGLKLGMAFQIADDVLDYMADENKLGKSLGKDLEEGKITLPLIYLLRNADTDEAAKVKQIISAEEITKSDLIYILDLLSKYKSIEWSYEKANSILQEAKAELDIFEDSVEKSALLTISDYSLTRGK